MDGEEGLVGGEKSRQILFRKKAGFENDERDDERFKKDRCWSHPHNFYLQWLTENGIIGFIFFIIYIFFIFYKVLISDYGLTYNKYSLIALSVIFWPIMSTGSLLKNWHGIETFFIIGLSLSLLNYKKNTN